MTNITFEKANLTHKEAIFTWLATPHFKEFWDNSQAHLDDIIIFMNGRKEESSYFDGTFTYWIGSINSEPFCFLITSQVTEDGGFPDLWVDNLSKTGNTYCIDFGIGNEKYLGQGLAAPTLQAFTKFFQEQIDEKADTFFIDPDENNPKAKHVYEKAGFKNIGKFTMEGGVFEGQNTFLMAKKLPTKYRLIEANINDYPIIQNMARFYVYDRSAYHGWACEDDGMFECIDFKHYFTEKDKYAYLIKVGDELAGFALIDKQGSTPNIDWNMGEYFIFAKFQGSGIAKSIAKELFNKFKGNWECSVIPGNNKALKFWRKVVDEYSNGEYTEEMKKIEEPEPHRMIIIGFKSK
jgi:predicted acetyltransferase